MTKQKPKKNGRAKPGPKTGKTAAVRMLAASLGVRMSAVYRWRAMNALPKNPLIRAAYLRAVGTTKKAGAR